MIIENVINVDGQDTLPVNAGDREIKEGVL